MTDFRVENLTKSVGDKTVFSQLNFIIHPLDRIGLIGVNGTGKTTLLDVISGKAGFDGDNSPFFGRNDYKIEYLTQDPQFDGELSIMDAILSDDLPQMQAIKRYEQALIALTQDAMNPKLQETLSQVEAQMTAIEAWEVENQVKTVLSKLKLPDLTAQIKNLSGGQKRRVQLAQALLNPADLLLLDEPTNHLDVDTIAWLENYVKNSRQTVLFITHDRYFLDNLATRIFELDNGHLIEYQGNYQDYLQQKAENDERESAQHHKNKQLYKQELAWIRKSPQARATKQQARIDRFEDIKKDVQSVTTSDDLTINVATARIGKKVINFDHVNFAYGADKTILNDFSLIVQNTDRIGIVGNNGTGKSTLLNLISGDLTPDSGSVEIGETIKIGYFSQQIRGLDESKRVINFLQEVADNAQTSSGESISVVNLLEQFLFPRTTHGTLIEKLSGGEKKRLYLLKILLQQPNVLLLDEPTNDLDIATLTVLENFIQHYQGVVITVSHDRYFLDKVAKKLLVFYKGTITEVHKLYSDYLTDKLSDEKIVAKTESKPVVKEKVVEKRRMSYAEKQEWATIETDIAALEEAIASIEAEMAENGADFTKLGDLQASLDDKNADLLAMYERYEYLSEF
ncbi:MAG: ABC-F family ATP-binding cassette domain-containing protein [Lactococcus raffinolactis]|uniref:ATP-binding cassette domain-containing protein n=1 Tax=Pseudolactococcus raffinolactis TaxID=1366 RepID=A0A6H0UGM9_9LACT|nr:ABC-F family ATP-binding cassette domain-containing protein [Lactococcus raffinolactis]MBR2541350.1 ABC-F family ATP-binding cassette domain-containing protein [Lactococcus sp.]MDN5494366.1 ABC-F family ATP-binding cassette domain-containing protein [Lactococcus raffinolactis]MDN5579568.1 ABC-F family ATP-binding cassette domain-containing protein [Lactococcus raffinolactis]MDN6036236.1 ABC-F family ATP-binding cassette domain-containing protein [Lactococcus raffinolactis]MDN6044672.1 ABC-F